MTERKLEVFVILLIYSISILYFSIRYHVEMIARIPQEVSKLEVHAFEKALGWYGDQWTGSEFSFFLSLKGKTIKIKTSAGNPDIKKRPLDLSLWVEGKPISSFRLTNSQWETLSIEIPPKCQNRRKYVIGRLSHTFVPKDHKISEDTRHLGILIGAIWTE